MVGLGPINQKLSSLQQERNQYLQQAKRDIETRRAIHNQQLNQYNREIKPLKRKVFFTSVKQNLMDLGKSNNRMIP